jgi:hypothetical protein
MNYAKLVAFQRKITTILNTSAVHIRRPKAISQMFEVFDEQSLNRDSTKIT